MANQIVQQGGCYVCLIPVSPFAANLINANDDHKDIAIKRRADAKLAPLPIVQNSKICLPCNNSIREELQDQLNPSSLRLNVFRGNNAACMFCNAVQGIHRLSLECRVNVFVKVDVFIPIGHRSCQAHLDDNGFILAALLPTLNYVNRSIVIQGAQFLPFLQELRRLAQKPPQFHIDESSCSEEDFQVLVPVTKEQFRDLHTYCDTVRVGNQNRNVSKRSLLTFLCKMRQGLSDNFLKVIFGYSSRAAVSLVITVVRMSLLIRFVPRNIGLSAITWDEVVDNHTPPYHNQLYNATPNVRKVIAYVDGTYSYSHKSTNHRGLRQSFSRHKSRHLFKPVPVLCPDGYFLDIQGPYFSDPKNNDAAALLHEFDTDPAITNWFKRGDIFILDRGYRDAKPRLQQLGYEVKMPNFLEGNRKQFTAEEANESRLVTATRFVIETRNGHLKSIFKFLGNTVIMPHLLHLGDFFRIAGAIINCYHPLIHIEGVTPAIAREMRDKVYDANVVQARVEVEGLRLRGGQWTHLTAQHVPDFPQVTLQFLKRFTYGTFQVRLAPSYIQDKLQREDEEEFQLDTHFIEPGFIRLRIFSRFRASAKHTLFLAYHPTDPGEEVPEEPILGWYCTCKSGARTLGSCAHIVSVIWYLGYARHEPNIRYPSTALFHIVKDAAGRPPPDDNF